MPGTDILVINCGSSSIKFALFDMERQRNVADGMAEKLGDADASLECRLGGEKSNRDIPGAGHGEAMQAVISMLEAGGDLRGRLGAVGHRVVHGGEFFSDSVRINDELLEQVERCNHLAPLHNPANLLGIRTARELFPDLPQVAVFDTAFHQTMPDHAYLYPVPWRLYEDHAVRRYGFHGTSHRFVAAQAAARLGRPLAECNLVTAHLGNGCSACAVRGGRSVDTTMGLTPLEGLVMGTRSGDVDPGLHAYLAGELDCGLDEINELLNRESGLLGLSGISNDMRTLVEAAEGGNDRADLAIRVFCYRLAKAVAALCVPLGRVDALVFTGGIGENSWRVRARTVEQLGVLGMTLDAARNAAHGRESEGRISPDGNGPAVLVVPTDEELMIARDTARLIG